MYINNKRLFFLAFIICLAINPWLPVTDPVEATYALSAKEMFEHGNWLTPTLFGAPWFDKPILFYFLTTVSFHFFGVSAFAARIVPALFTAASLTLLFWFVSRHASRKEALLAVLVLGSSLQFLILSKQIITDMVLFFFTNAALVFLYTGWQEKAYRLRWTLAAYACAAFAVLTKGPVGIIIPGMIMLAFIAYKKDWSALKQLFHPAGLLLFAIIALPWYAEMTQRFGSDFLSTFFGLHNYLRATVSEHPKDNVFFYYPVLFFLSTLPWSLSAIRALYDDSRAVWKRTADSLTALSVLWAGVYLVFYSLMATKYPTYTFPALFPAAILTARYLSGHEQSLVRQLRPALLLLAVLFGGLSIVYSHHIGKIMVPLFLTFMLYYTWKQVDKKLLLASGAFAILAFMLSAGTSLDNLAQSRSGAALSQSITGYANAPIGLYRSYSTSAVFYSGATLIQLEDAPLLTIDNSVWGQKYHIPTESVNEFLQAARADEQPSLIIVKAQDRNAFEQIASVSKTRGPVIVASPPLSTDWKKDLHAYSPR